MLKEIIENMIYENNGVYYHNRDEYDEGYTDGFHDALVVLLDKLEIEHKHIIINQ